MADLQAHRQELHDRRTWSRRSRARRNTPKTTAPKACCSASCCSARCRTRACAHRRERGARDAGCEGDPHGRRFAGAGRQHHSTTARHQANTLDRARADQRAAVSGRADPRRGGGGRAHGGRSDRADPPRLRAAPFVVDPLDSLRPGGPNARTEGNVWASGRAGSRPASCAAAAARRQELKWTDEDFAAGRARASFPMGEAHRRMVVRRSRRRFQGRRARARRDLRQPTPAISARDRARAMAYWQNGKLYLHAPRRAGATVRGSRALGRDLEPEDVVLISEYTGGGFGSKITGAHDGDPGAAVEEDQRAGDDAHHARGRALHRPRAPRLHRPREDRLRQDGRITALDLFLILDNGPYDAQGDAPIGGPIWSRSLYQPMAMRWRGVTVPTNTPPRSAQRAPGGMQGIAIIEPLLAQGGAQARASTRWRSAHQRAGGQGGVRPVAAAASGSMSPARS